MIALLLAIRILEPGAPPPAGYEEVPPPGIEMKMNMASATTVPWIDGNGWRFQRGIRKAFYSKVPPEQAALAAAEAFAYGVDAILDTPPSQPLTQMLAFLKTVEAPPLPPRANFTVIDDGSDDIPEVLNLLTRRNLAYRVVKSPDPKMLLNVRADKVEDANDFAARIREKVTDDKRVVRLFGTYTVLAHLTGDETRSRLHLLNYSKRPMRDVRVRVLGRFGTIRLAEAHDPKQQPADVLFDRGATEFTVPNLTTYAVVDLGPKP